MNNTFKYLRGFEYEVLEFPFEPGNRWIRHDRVLSPRGIVYALKRYITTPNTLSTLTNTNLILIRRIRHDNWIFEPPPLDPSPGNIFLPPLHFRDQMDTTMEFDLVMFNRSQLMRFYSMVVLEHSAR